MQVSGKDITESSKRSAKAVTARVRQVPGGAGSSTQPELCVCACAHTCVVCICVCAHALGVGSRKRWYLGGQSTQSLGRGVRGSYPYKALAFPWNEIEATGEFWAEE